MFCGPDGISLRGALEARNPYLRTPAMMPRCAALRRGHEDSCGHVPTRGAATRRSRKPFAKVQHRGTGDETSTTRGCTIRSQTLDPVVALRYVANVDPKHQNPVSPRIKHSPRYAPIPPMQHDTVRPPRPSPRARPRFPPPMPCWVTGALVTGAPRRRRRRRHLRRRRPARGGALSIPCLQIRSGKAWRVGPTAFRAAPPGGREGDGTITLNGRGGARRQCKPATLLTAPWSAVGHCQRRAHPSCNCMHHVGCHKATHSHTPGQSQSTYALFLRLQRANATAANHDAAVISVIRHLELTRPHAQSTK